MVQLLIIAATAAFFILLAKKVGIVEFIQRRAPRLLSKLAECDFCMSFWCGAVLCVAMALWMRDAWWLAAPVVTTPITRILL